jgi:dephospho-CoA kinase
MNEIMFIIEDADEGGYIARALGASIFTEADSLDELNELIRDAVCCHFNEAVLPKIIRLFER